MFNEENLDIYLNAFNQIEDWLKRKYKTKEEYQPFGELLRIASQKNYLVDKFHDDLDKFSNLRNAIVHTPSKVYLAIPLDETIVRITKIKDYLFNPPTINNLFIKNVIKFQSNDHIKSVFKIMNEKNISQVPVIENNVVIGLLSNNTIARWYGRSLIASQELDLNINVKEILKYTETKNDFEFVSRSETVDAVLKRFSDRQEKGINLNALIVTENGKPNESVLGLLNTYDIAKLIKHSRI